VQGRLILEVSSGQDSMTLASHDIDQILDPGDSVTADFVFLVPSGSYSISARFEPS
jgi:hypothetical protein